MVGDKNNISSLQDHSDNICEAYRMVATAEVRVFTKLIVRNSNII